MIFAIVCFRELYLWGTSCKWLSLLAKSCSQCPPYYHFDICRINMNIPPSFFRLLICVFSFFFICLNSNLLFENFKEKDLYYWFFSFQFLSYFDPNAYFEFNLLFSTFLKAKDQVIQLDVFSPFLLVNICLLSHFT